MNPITSQEKRQPNSQQQAIRERVEASTNELRDIEAKVNAYKPLNVQEKQL